MRYQHLSLGERQFIETQRKLGTSMEDIGKSLGRTHSTISREISRNTGPRGYRHKQAQKKAQARHKEKPKAIKMTEALKEKVTEYLKKDWSPEQIAGRLQQQQEECVHFETIYKFVLLDKKSGGQLYLKLRRHGKKYRKRYGSPHNRTGIPNRVDISKRPEVANKRKRVGDWEADTIIGKGHQGAIVTLDERKTKLRLAAPMSQKLASTTRDWIIELLTALKGFVKSITFDNGKEFARHEDIAQALGCKTYFAQPYHSWERGQNENANGLLRQYFPKMMKLSDVKFRKVVDALHKLNSRPRKCLGYRTPYEAFKEATGINVRKLLECALMT